MDQPFLGGNSTTKPAAEDQSDFDIGEYWSIIKRHWLTVAAAGILGAGWGFVQFLNTPEKFQATTQVQIERRMPGPLGGQNAWIQAAWNPEFYPTQYEILKGQGLAERVVEHLQLWNDADFEAMTGRASSYNAEGNTAEDDQQTTRRLAGSIRGGLKISPVRSTQLVNITYTARSPAVAAKLANGYAQAFIEQGQNVEASATNALAARIAQEISNAEAAISRDEALLFQLSEATDLVAPGNADTGDSRYASVNRQLNDAQQRRIAAQAEYNSLRAQPDSAVAQLIAPSEFGDARNKLLELQSEYRTKGTLYRENSKVMTDLQQDINEEQRRFDSTVTNLAARAIAEARSTYEKAQREEATQRSQFQRLRGEVRRSQPDINSADNLRDSLNTQRTTLATLRSNQQQVAVATGDAGTSHIRQIALAYPPGGPISPILRQELTSGTGLGLFIGVALVLLLELLDRTVKTPAELERRLNLAVLAAIPDLDAGGRYGRYGYGYGYGYGNSLRRGERKKRSKKKGGTSIDLLPHKRPRIAVSEAYRGLRTSLLLSSAEELKVIAVTSSFASEGKTATAVNLATVLAQLGKKTLLIDGDLRKARIHEVMKVSNRSGLVNYLVGAQPIEKVVLPTEVENLFAAPAGPAPPNPSELLGSTRMRHFLQEARRAFDFVVIDTPPVLAVTDATILGSLTDGVVITCRAARVTRDELKSCRDRLQFGGVKVLGTVLNCYRPRAGRKEKGYSSYHYETYGHEDETVENADTRRGEVA